MSKEVFFEFTKRGSSVSELREYYAKTGKAKALALSKGLINDGRIAPGVFFSLYYELHSHSFAEPQIKNVNQDARNTILKNVIEQIGDELLTKLTPDVLTEYFKNCANDMSTARNTSREQQQDNSKWFNACLSIFRPIFQYAVIIKQIKENPIDIIERKKYMNPNLIITKRLSRMVLSAEEEAELFEQIAAGLYHDDRYFALSMALVLAIGPQELCHIKYGDVIENETFPIMSSLRLHASVEDKESEAFFEREEASRNIPLPPEILETINRMRGTHSDDDYILCDGNGRRLNSGDLRRFFLLKLYEIDAQKASYKLEAAEGVREHNFKLMASLLQSHARFSMREHCGLTDSEIRYISGLSQGKNTDGAHYRDWNADITQYGLYLKLCRRKYDFTKPVSVHTHLIKIPEGVSSKMVFTAPHGCTVNWHMEANNDQRDSNL